jgi:hypothetical protein
MNDADVLENVEAAFAGQARPEHFTTYLHCEECAEHDEVLRSRTRESLTVANVGNPSWDPICFVTDEGFRYYFPALAKLALEPPTAGHGWYFEQLLFHLNDADTPQKRRPACSPKQGEAVARFLQHILDTRGPRVVEHMCEDELRAAISLWSEAVLDRTP